MSDQAFEIGGLVESLVVPLLDYPADLRIDSTETEDGAIRVDIEVNSEDTGKVIGRQGRVIKSIRTLARAAASRHDMRVEVEILD